MAIDMLAFLQDLGQERYRAVILHAPPDKGPAVSQFAQKVCRKSGGTYLDLLELFIQSPELSQHIDSFSPEKLRALLIEQSHSNSLLVVDRVDFILDTWSRAERQIFFRMVNDQWDSFKDSMRAKLIVCLQSSQEVEALRLRVSQVSSRVLHLSEFNDIA